MENTKSNNYVDIELNLTVIIMNARIYLLEKDVSIETIKTVRMFFNIAARLAYVYVGMYNWPSESKKLICML